MKPGSSIKLKIALWLIILSALISGLKMLREKIKYTMTHGTDVAEPIINRFVWLRDFLPAQGVIGYTTDLKNGDLKFTEFSLAQYVLSPLILEDDINHPLIIGDFERPIDGLAVLRDQHLILIKRSNRGVFLYKKE